MRRKHTLIMASGLIVSSATLWAAGCGTAPQSTPSTGGAGGRDSGTGNGPSGSTTSGSTTGASTASASTASANTASASTTSGAGEASASTTSGTSGGDGGPDVPDCTGDPTKDPTVIDKACGLFVRGDATDTDGPGAGTPDKPFKTLQAAINAVADPQLIFVCTKNTFAEKVTIAKANVAIYGGFDCTNPTWVWKEGARSTILGPADTAAMTVSSQGAKIEQLRIQAAKATKPGGSSIAVLVNAANPSFNQSDMIADQAKPGADGVDASSPTAPAGIAGQTGQKACSKDTVPGATQVANTCPGATVSIGGSGGEGTPFNGNPGVAGEPSYGGGQAGQGEPSNNPTWSCALNGGQGKNGLPGAAGVKGDGATGARGGGALDTNGFTPISGKDGTPGQPGQGGGGGGGVKGGAACTVATKGGASGGSGGSGGCGGQAGKGGKGAGASIALVSLKSPNITLTNVTLTAANGVNGGVGGDAQGGGSSANGGAGGTSGGVFGLKNGCAGGIGGQGGDGGPGGGGLGGHSIGLAYTGGAPTIDLSKVVVGAAGQGGAGGNNNLLNNKGENGKVAKTLLF